MMMITCVNQVSKNSNFDLHVRIWIGNCNIVIHFQPELSRPFSLGSEVLSSDSHRL